MNVPRIWLALIGTLVMLRRPLPSGILALAAAMGIGRFAYTPLLPAMQLAGGLTTAQAGFLATANYAGYLAGALLISIMAPPAVQTWVLRTAAIGVVATTALMAVTDTLVAWGLIRFLSGLASAGVLIVVSGVVLADLRQHGKVSLGGWLFSGVGLGITIAGVVVWTTERALGWRGEWIVLAVLAAVAFSPGWWSLRVAPSRIRPSGPARRERHHDERPLSLVLLYVAYFLEGIGYIVTGTFLVAIVAQTPGVESIGAGVWIVVGLAAIPSAVLWGALGARVGYGYALTSAYLLQGAGIVLPVLATDETVLASAILFGGTFAGITALTLTLGPQLVPHRSTAVIGMLTAIFGVGQMVGPVLAGVIADHAGSFNPALVAAAAVVTGAGILMLVLPWTLERDLRAGASLDGSGR